MGEVPSASEAERVVPRWCTQALSASDWHHPSLPYGGGAERQRGGEGRHPTGDLSREHQQGHLPKIIFPSMRFHIELSLHTGMVHEEDDIRLFGLDEF